MSGHEPVKKPSRRDLLKIAGLTAGAAALPAAVVKAGNEPRREQVMPRYRETEHVKRFYALNRL